jgi:hypothetical protein
MEALKNKPQEQAILGIIQDAIIWHRVADKMHDIINAFNPLESEHEFQVEDHYKGYRNALYIMGLIHDDNICGQLSDIFWQLSSADKMRNDQADELAHTIYIEWLVCIKNYHSTLLKTAV